MNERPTQPHDGGQAFTPTHTAKLCERIAELEQELDDWRNAAKGAENPHPCEVHCTCVPLLRKLLQDAQAEIERLISIEP
jgi:hypothetical protein